MWAESTKCEIRLNETGSWPGSRFLLVRIENSGQAHGKAWVTDKRPETSSSGNPSSKYSDDVMVEEATNLTSNVAMALWRAIGNLPTAPTSAIEYGMDGTNYMLEVESAGFLIRYAWWSHLPTEWSELSVVLALLEGITHSSVMTGNHR